MYFYEKVIESDYYDLEEAKEKINAFHANKKRLEFSKTKVNKLKDNIIKQRHALKYSRKRYEKVAGLIAIRIKAV